MAKEKNTILIPGQDAPMVEVSPSDDYLHMLREPDKERFREFLEFLERDGTLHTYLGGGVVKSWIYNGRQDYSDIDLIAVNELWNHPLARLRNEELVRMFQKASQHGGIITGKYAFSVKNLKRQVYMNMQSLDERFRFSPAATREELRDNKYASPIDLVICSPSNFLRSQRRR